MTAGSASPTSEVELKAVVPDLRRARHLVDDAGARLVFAGRMEDRRYDAPDRLLSGRDEVLRLRTYRSAEHTHAELDWKGRTRIENGFKVRDEITTGLTDPDALAAMLLRLGYRIIREIDRDIAKYVLNDTVIRFERYPRMDTLVEVEGTPAGIDSAIAVLDIPRPHFTTERLPDFVRAYEKRTGLRAAISERELAGEYRYSVRDA